MPKTILDHFQGFSLKSILQFWKRRNSKVTQEQKDAANDYAKAVIDEYKELRLKYNAMNRQARRSPYGKRIEARLFVLHGKMQYMADSLKLVKETEHGSVHK